VSILVRRDDESVANDGVGKKQVAACLRNVYVLLHGQLGVELDAQVSNDRGRDNNLLADLDMMLLAVQFVQIGSRPKPDDFCLVSV